jgi:hypothetical protein
MLAWRCQRVVVNKNGKRRLNPNQLRVKPPSRFKAELAQVVSPVP